MNQLGQGGVVLVLADIMTDRWKDGQMERQMEAYGGRNRRTGNQTQGHAFKQANETKQKGKREENILIKILWKELIMRVEVCKSSVPSAVLKAH